MCLLHAIVAHGWHFSNRLTHAPSSIVAFRYFTRPLSIKSLAGKHPLTTASRPVPSHIWSSAKYAFFFRLLSQSRLVPRQVPNYTLSYDEKMVLVQGTLFVHHSDSSILTFWKFEFSPNEHDAEPINLPQPKVELFRIRVDEPSQSQQLRQT